MQLTKPRSAGVALGIAQLAAGLFAAGASAAHAQSAPTPASDDSFYSQGRDPGQSRADAAVLVYQEAGGRVRAIEPAINATFQSTDNSILSIGLVADTLTGASPNGATPANQTQTFLTPLKAVGSSTTVTRASGGSQVVQLPPTPGQIAAAALYGRQYTTDPGKLPVDPGFHDQRFAANIGYSQPVGRLSRAGLGFAYSEEHDFRAISGNANVSRDFNSRNTTLSLAVNFEFDTSFPYGGTPTPFTEMSAQIKGPNQTRHVADGVFGLTQIMSRNWLVQLNYSYGVSKGYQTDPYRIISVVDQNSGEPLKYLYESRPDNRVRQSVYLENKIALGPQTFDLSGRYFWDDWGIRSTTLDLADRIALGPVFYIQPHVRWYHQSEANFFRPYLVSGQALPQYASSDTRLGAFSALTLGTKVGVKVTSTSEFYVRGEYYRQSGDGHPPGVFGQLAQQNLFAGVSAISGTVGYTLNF